MSNWNELMALAMQTQINYWFTALYFVSWIFIGNFILLNLYLAILLDSFIEEKEEEDLEQVKEEYK
jgi:hypothetical protein